MFLHALDLGAQRLAHVVMDGNQQVVSTVNLAAPKNTKDEDFYVEAFDHLTSTFTAGDVVFVEEPLVGRGGVKTAIRLSSVRGVCHLAAAKSGCDVYAVNVQTWKKAIIGKGNSSKDDVAAWVESEHPSVHRSLDASFGRHRQDGIDAFCIALYASRTLGISSHIVGAGLRGDTST